MRALLGRRWLRLAPLDRGSAIPKPPKKAKKKAKRRRYAKPAATGTYAYESAPVSVRAKKRKAAKKR